MAILPSVTNNKKRQLTTKQQAFLEHLVETQGDAKQAAELAGYTSHYHHVVKTLKNEIIQDSEKQRDFWKEPAATFTRLLK